MFIKLDVKSFHNALAIQIIDQSVNIPSNFIFVASNDFRIETLSCPECTGNSFFMQGTSVKNKHDVCHKKFDSNAARDQYISCLFKALNEASKSVHNQLNNNSINDGIIIF